MSKEKTVTGRKPSGVVVYSTGGFSSNMTCLVHVFPDSAAPNKTT